MGTNNEDLVLRFMAEQVNLVQQIDVLVKKLDKLEGKTEKVGKKSKTMGERMSAGFKKAGKAAQNFSKKVVKLGVVMGTAGLIGTIFKSAKAAASFETKMREVSTLLGTHAEPKMKKFNKAVREMAKTTSATANELSSGLYQVISAGTKGTEDAEGAMRLLDQANKMSVAGVSDVFSSVDVLTTSLNAWGASTEEATAFSDQMFKAVELGKLTLNDLSAGLGVVASAAAGAGLSFGEVNAALATMTASGVPPRRAMTALNAIIRVAAKGSKELDAAFGETSSGILERGGLMAVMEKLQEVTGGDTIALQKLGIEQEAITGLAVLAGTGMDKFRTSLDAMGKATGATELAYKKMSKTFEFQSKKFKNVINDVFISIGNEILPFLIKKMEEIAKWVQTHEKDIKDFVKEATESIIAFGEFIIENGATIATLFTAIWVSSLGPIGLVAAGIGLVLAGLNKLADWMGPGGKADAVMKGLEVMGIIDAPDNRTEKDFKWDEDTELRGPSGASLFGFGKPTKSTKKKKKKGPLGKGPKLLPEDIRGEGTPFGAGFMIGGVLDALTRAGAAAGFALTDVLTEKHADLMKFADDFASESVDTWYQKIGGPELETIEERRAYAFAESLAKKTAEPSFWDDVATGFKESIGAKLSEMMFDAGKGLLKPFDQIKGLLNMAMSGESVDAVRGAAEMAVDVWESLAENLGPVLDYLISEGIPMILDAFVKHIPGIIETLMEAVPALIATIISYIPEIVGALIEGLAKGIAGIFEKLWDAINPFEGNVSKKQRQHLKAAGKTKEEADMIMSGIQMMTMSQRRHAGGFIERASGVASGMSSLATAIRAHSGLFVTPRMGLAADEVPIIAQAGEGVIRKEIVSAMGGAGAINAQNQGIMPGGGGDVHLHTEYLYANDAMEVVDSMQAEMQRRGAGRMQRVIGGENVSGFVPGRK